MRRVGLHLQQTAALIGTPRPSVVAEIGPDGALVRLEEVHTDDEVVAAVGPGPATVVVDAPLVAPPGRGRRDVEVLLSWLDCPVFPVSRDRLVALHGEVCGERIAARLRGAGADVVEGVPDVVLRHLMWTAAGSGGAALGLEAHRAGWLALRAPRYRPKGAGRAVAAGLLPAWTLLAAAVDMGGWAPGAGDGDWGPIADAARLDAVACALTARMLVDEPGSVARMGSRDLGEVAVPASPDMRERIAVNLARLRAEGAVRF